MALSNKELQRRFRQRRQQEATVGLQRVTLALPMDVANRIKSLAGFFELKQEEIVERAINNLWDIRFKIGETKDTIIPIEFKTMESDFMKSTPVKPKRKHKDKLPTVEPPVEPPLPETEEEIKNILMNQ